MQKKTAIGDIMHVSHETPLTEAGDFARYTSLAIALHWMIAGLILCNLVLGFLSALGTPGAHRAALDLHKSIGIGVLFLSVCRLLWRLAHRPPALSTVLKGWERRLARFVHGGFYVLMIGLPLAGWWISSAVPIRHAIGLFGTFDVPFLPVAQSMADAKFAHGVHESLAFVMLGAIAIHLAGIVKHTFDKAPVLHRMLPLLRRRRATR